MTRFYATTRDGRGVGSAVEAIRQCGAKIVASYSINDVYVILFESTDTIKGGVEKLPCIKAVTPENISKV